MGLDFCFHLVFLLWFATKIHLTQVNDVCCRNVCLLFYFLWANFVCHFHCFIPTCPFTECYFTYVSIATETAWEDQSDSVHGMSLQMCQNLWEFQSSECRLHLTFYKTCSQWCVMPLWGLTTSYLVGVSTPVKQAPTEPWSADLERLKGDPRQGSITSTGPIDWNRNKICVLFEQEWYQIDYFFVNLYLMFAFFSLYFWQD